MLSSQPRSTTTGTTTNPQVQPLDKSPSPKNKDKGRDKDKGKGGTQEVCKYFMKASGCKRGLKCDYSHSMAGLDREVRNTHV